jgi:hypothetical protein
VGIGTAQGQPDPALYIPSRYPAGLSGQSDPDNPAPPDIPPWGGGYSGLEGQKLIHSKFSKTEVIFDEKNELMCID